MRPRICFQFPTWFQHLYRGVTWRQKESSKVIYLTFDDSCTPQVTPQLLALLREWGIHATFFCVGDNIRNYPELCQQIVQEGHTVGNHTFHHVAGLRTSLKNYLKEVEQTDQLIDAIYLQCGKQRERKLFRPPYGKMTLFQRLTLAQTHTIVLWDILTHDYNKDYTPTQIMQAIQRYTRPGSIIVFHDSIKSRENLFAVLPQALAWWQSNGYQLRIF